MGFLILVVIAIIALAIFTFGKVPENRKARLTLATGLALALAGTLISNYAVYTFAGKSIMIVGVLVFAGGVKLAREKEETPVCSQPEEKPAGEKKE